jgi:hypothetical protein
MSADSNAVEKALLCFGELGEHAPALAARNLLNSGLLLIAAAFDIDETLGRPWTFSKGVRLEARVHGNNLISLFRESTLLPQLGAPVEQKAEFQRFMLVATGAPKKKLPG